MPDEHETFVVRSATVKPNDYMSVASFLVEVCDAASISPAVFMAACNKLADMMVERARKDKWNLS